MYNGKRHPLIEAMEASIIRRTPQPYRSITFTYERERLGEEDFPPKPNWAKFKVTAAVGVIASAPEDQIRDVQKRLQDMLTDEMFGELRGELKHLRHMLMNKGLQPDDIEIERLSEIISAIDA